MYVEVRSDTAEDLDRALRRLRKAVNKAGVLKELRRRRYHVKPSDRRRRKRQAAASRRRREDERRRQR